MAKTAAKTEETKTPKPTKTAKAEGRFVQLINRNGDEILKGRGQRIIDSAKSAQTKLVLDLEDEIRKIEDEREFMLDMSPDNRYSLKVGESFDASQFTREYQRLSIAIINKKVELEIARNNQKDLF